MSNKPGKSDVQEDQGVQTNLENFAQMLREKILFGLQVYPYLSPTMLHVFLQTATPAGIWKPILNELIVEGLVVSEEVTLTSPHERTQTYTILHLATTPYTAFPTRDQNLQNDV